MVDSEGKAAEDASDAASADDAASKPPREFVGEDGSEDASEATVDAASIDDAGSQTSQK